MADDFARALAIVIDGIEKGYTVDSGGPTMYGVTQAIAQAHGYTGDMRELPRSLADAIYREYWDGADCDRLPWPLACFVFDAAVNQGGAAEIDMLQKALGVAQDGILGKSTLAALAKLPALETASLFMAARALRYMGTRKFDTYGRGWLKRLFVVALSAV